jgi:hypothetical protein
MYINMSGITPFKQVGINGTSPRDASYKQMQENNNALTKLGKVGGKRRTKRGGQMVAVPSVPMNGLKDPAAGTSQGISQQITNNSKITLDNQAQSALDSKVTLVPVPSKGGRRNRSKRMMSKRMMSKRMMSKRIISKRKMTKRNSTKRYGGFIWPCMSGGKEKRKGKGKSRRN